MRKTCTTARQSGSVRSQTAWTDDNIDALLFYILSYSYTNWILWERNTSFGCKFTQLQHYQILLKSVNIWPSNQKIERVNLLLRHRT